ncbi:hypothetical protein F5884DRAFT_439996 [Xylogone sp. PMI_703]|nr:hypothetical protein F5884DRAFT_439996 [Xylogone sp. PMI_703]
MRSATLALGAFVLGVANAWTYPDCQPDNCYRELIDPRFYTEAQSFCPGYLSSPSTAIPPDFSNCDTYSALSSACSCITYSMTSPPTTTTTTVPVTTTTTETTTSVPTTTTTTTGYQNSTTPCTTSSVQTTSVQTTSVQTTSSVEVTTSTIYTTTVRTVTSCAPTVTNCPGGPQTVTETISIGTTVCPVTSTYVPPPPPVYTTSTIYITTEYTVTSCAPTVTNCPGGPHVTTETISVGTTVCPVTSTYVPPPPPQSSPVLPPPPPPASTTPLPPPPPPVSTPTPSLTVSVSPSSNGTIPSFTPSASPSGGFVNGAGRFADGVNLATVAVGMLIAWLL